MRLALFLILFLVLLVVSPPLCLIVSAIYSLRVLIRFVGPLRESAPVHRPPVAPRYRPPTRLERWSNWYEHLVFDVFYTISVCLIYLLTFVLFMWANQGDYHVCLLVIAVMVLLVHLYRRLAYANRR